MEGAYFTYFTNPFESLRMDRPAYKAQAAYSLHAATTADLGAAFAPLLVALQTAIDGFDENLTDRNQSTAGGTDAYHAARTAWLAFVDDTMKDYITPKLRKLPVYADFKKFGKSKLSALKQPTLLTKSKALVAAGNGLIALVHQLIAAKLNVAKGADDSAIAASIAAADALIGDLSVPPVGAGSLAPSATSGLITALANYNEGKTGPGHCD